LGAPGTDCFDEKRWVDSFWKVSLTLRWILFWMQSTLVSIGEHGTRLLHREEGYLASSLDTSGLLWGNVLPSDDKQNTTIEVWDAEDAPDGDSKPLERVIDPLQVVVGWYRVSNSTTVEEDPTADDLLLSQQWQQRYAPNATAPFLFALLSNNSNSSNRLSFYMLHQQSNSSVLLSLEDHWSLKTAPSERLAVESLFHVTAPAWPELDARLQPLEQALRLQQQQEISDSNAPESAALRRQVQGLLDHLALCSSSNENAATKSSTARLLPTLAALAQCVAATQPYLEKQRLLLPVPSDAFPESSKGRGRGPAGERPWRTSRRYAGSLS
jgi:hypothetical protein